MRLIILRQEQPTSEGSIVFGISRRDPRITYAVSSQTSFAWHIACSADAVLPAAQRPRPLLARRVLTLLLRLRALLVVVKLINWNCFHTLWHWLVENGYPRVSRIQGCL